MLDTQGWDLSPVWPMRLHARYNRFVAIPPSDTACLLYRAIEPHAFVMVARLAVFRHRAHPVLILDAPKMECLSDLGFSVQWNRAGNILFVAVNIEWPQLRRVAYPLAVLDLERAQFSFIVGRSLSAHSTTEIAERTFRLVEQELGYERRHYDPLAFEVNLDTLLWYGFGRIDDFHDLYKAEHERRGLLRPISA
jgi:hypothetical protein